MNSINIETNTAHLCGEVLTDKVFSHQTYGENFYTFEIGIERNSGYVDCLNIMASDRIMTGLDLSHGNFVEIDGQVRTYNEDIEGRNKLNVVVFAKEMYQAMDEIPINDIHLVGYICKEPIGRISPLGRKICDIMLAVNRMYNKSDYIPCIAWGRSAIYAQSLEVGDKITLKGRLQSRQYKKKIDDKTHIVKIAFEVSILQLESEEDW